MTQQIQNEEWRPIKGYEGQYQVSNLGRVKSLGRYKRTKGNAIFWFDGRILKQYINNAGYLMIGLWDEKIKRFLVHRLVAEAFIPNPDNLPQVNHRDENKTNNSVDNLEWCDCKYNINYGTCIQRSKSKRGKPVICVEKGILYQSAHEASRQTGISRGNICNCCRGGCGYKTTGGYHWRFAS